MATKSITVLGHQINYMPQDASDFVCLTDMARGQEGEPGDHIRNWLRNGSTVEFLGVWEKVHNPDFNLVEFHQIKSELTRNTFLMSTTKWIERTGATGIEARAGRYGGTYGHSDIALHFANWLSPEFYVYFIKEFQRLKAEEAQQAHDGLEWSVRRMLSKANYLIHTDAVRTHLVPERVARTKFEGLYFASEADLLNLALFGLTAKEWRATNPEAKGNMRESASAEQLLVLSNLESLNAEFIKQGLAQAERVQRLNEVAIYQMNLLVNVPSRIAGFTGKGLPKGNGI